jgi:hypothetical protein
MVRVEGVDLHAKIFTPQIPTFLVDLDKVQWVYIPKVMAHHPSIA